MNSISIYPYKEDLKIRKMRVQAWFRAVSLASGLTPRELEKKFSNSNRDRKVKRSCVWDKYRRGEVVPRSGTRPDGEPNLVDQVEAIYPGTAKWLSLPLWRLLDKTPMEMSEIRRAYESLPSSIRAMFIQHNLEPSSVFWRRGELDSRECDVLLRFENLDGLTAVLVMLRESECIQSKHQNTLCLHKAREYVERIRKNEKFRELAQQISNHLL